VTDQQETVRAYDLDARAYADAGPPVPDSVRRGDLPAVLARLVAVTRPGGMLRISVKEGDGEGWSTHGSVRHRRHFTYWRADALAAAVAGSGWSDVAVRSGVEGSRGETWLEVSAVRDEVSP
jgi:hypothetical protein